MKNEIAREVPPVAPTTIRATLAQRFGDSILLVPPASGIDSIVWVLPVVVLVLGLVGLGLAFRRWRLDTAGAGTPWPRTRSWSSRRCATGAAARRDRRDP